MAWKTWTTISHFNVDILTPKGQKTLVDEQRAWQIFSLRYSGFVYAETPKDKPAAIDALIISKGIIRACIETKCRYDCDLKKFQNEYQNKWLITFDKIEKGREISKMLGVSFVGFLYLKQSDTLLFQVISNAAGLYVPDIETSNTQTQATINGGTIVRKNAFINMNNATILKGN